MAGPRASDPPLRATARPPRPRIVGAVAVLVVAAALTAAAWHIWRPRDGPAAPRPLVVIVSGDTAGWIVPCGCASKQSGGMPRRGTYVAQARRAADVLVLDAGGAAGGASEYQRLKFAAILRGEAEMGVAAHNLGASEAELEADDLRRVAAETGVTLVSSNVRDDAGDFVGEPLEIVQIGGRRVAIAGVLSPQYSAGRLRVDEPRQSVLDQLAMAGRYDVLVVLAYLPEEELAAFAAALPEADLVVGGPTGQSIPPRRSGPTVWAAATNKGKFLAHLIAPPPASDGMWTGKIVELGPEWADHPAQTANLRRYHAELFKRDFAAQESGLVPALPPGLPVEFRIAGTESCRDCHTADCQHWDNSRHAQAWHTLASRGSHVDPYCQQCHTTGYGLPGGFVSAARSAELVNVGCESCHGPSHSHVLAPQNRTSYLAGDRCVECHDRENSPQFEYAGFWQRIRHGAPLEQASAGHRPEPAR